MDKPIVPHQIRKVFEGRDLHRAVVETITLPKGGQLNAEIVRHPGSVVLVPMTDDGEIVLVRQYRHAIGRWAWELPAGTLKPNEEPKKAAARECQEEIGLIPSRARDARRVLPDARLLRRGDEFLQGDRDCVSPARTTSRPSRTRTRTSRSARSRWTRCGR